VPGKAKKKETLINIPKPAFKFIKITLKGDSPLLTNPAGKKLRDELYESGTKKPKHKREAMDPQKEYEASIYYIDKKKKVYGVPAAGLIKCAVNACRLVDDLSMTLAKRLFYIVEDGYEQSTGQPMVALKGTPQLHEAVVRNPTTRRANLRYRAVWPKWEITFTLRYLSNMITPEQILNLFELAGSCEGFCENRVGAPDSAGGNNGCFHVKRGK
jgi:hypothetical protein